MAIESRNIANAWGESSIYHDQSVAEGEHLLAFVSWYFDADSDPVSMPGWDEIGFEDGEQFTPFLKVFQRVATASEPWPYTVSAANDNFGAVVVASSGVDTADPLAADPVFAVGGRSNGSAPSVAPDTAPVQAVWAVAHQNPRVEPTITWSDVDGELGGFYTNWLHMSVAYGRHANTFPTGERDWGIAPYGGNTDAVTVGLALRSGDSGPPAVNLAVRKARAVARASRPLLSVKDQTTPTRSPLADAVPRRGWKFILGPSTGGWKWELANVQARKCNFRRGAPSTVQFTLDGRDPLADRVVELSTDVHVLRTRRANGRTEQLYRGRVGSVGDELSETGHTMTVPSVDYRGVLDRRILGNGAKQSWDGFDQLWIAYGLIDEAQKEAGGDYGIANGNEPSGVTITREFELGVSIGGAINELAQSSDGFDWDVVPTGSSGLEFKGWAPERGDSRNVVLEYGGLARSVSRAVDSSGYANAVRVTGRAPDGSDIIPIYEAEAAELGDPEVFPQGRWDKTFTSELTSGDAVDARTAWLLDHHQVVRPSYTVRLRAGFWDGPSHIWLGDAVRLVIKSGRLRVDNWLRVEEIAVDISDSGAEEVALTLGAPRPDFAERTSDMEKRLTNLERR